METNDIIESSDTVFAVKNIQTNDIKTGVNDIRIIILAAAVGTLIEWYDFFVYGSLATTLASKFYKTGTPDGDIIVWLGSFAVGFIVRPFGALVFGHMGDIFGRKYTFLVTLILMGACTFLVGCLPTIDTIGPVAGYILIFLRIMQGLAIGGECNTDFNTRWWSCYLYFRTRPT
jgi:MFS family permease